MGGATPMLKRHSLFERCVTFPAGTWSVAHKQSFRCFAGNVHNLTTSYFERKETVCWQQDSHLWLRSPFCLSSLCQTRSSLSLFFVYPTYHIRKMKPGACLRTQAVGTSPRHNRDGSEKVRTIDKRAHRHKPL